MKTKIAPRASRQIADIYDYYYFNETPERANKVLISFYTAFESCATHPYKFPKAKSFSNSNHIRKSVIHRTFIFRYHIYQHHIRIISIIHGNRNV